MRDGKIAWSIVNQSLCVLWSEYWTLMEKCPASALRLKFVIQNATRELRK